MRKIILVDDIRFHLLSTRERLKSLYEVYTAQSSSDLFEVLEKVMPELILLDVNMPEVDGFEILEKLKDDWRYSFIPVIFLTSKTDKKSILKGMNLGAIDIVPKPFNDADLIGSIERCINPEVMRNNKPTILAVDDNPTELQTINFFLQDKYIVYTLPDPGKLKELLKVITPDLFLLDCQMPDISGFDLVPVIRSAPKHEETPIIFITSAGSVDNVSIAMHLGASDFLVKPVDEITLLEKTAQLLDNFIMRRRLRDLTPSG